MPQITINIAPQGQPFNSGDSNQVQALQLLMNAALHYVEENATGNINYPVDLDVDGIYGPNTNDVKIFLFGNVALYKNQLMAIAAAIPEIYLTDIDYAYIARYLGSSTPTTTPTPKPPVSTAPGTTQPGTTPGSFNMASVTPLLLIAAAGLAMSGSGKKKVSGIDAEKVKPWLFVIGGVIVLGYGTSIINQIMQIFHLSKGAGEKAVETESSNPNSPWSPNFYKAAPTGSLLLTTSVATDLADQIWNALGYTYDDFNAIQGVFRQLKTKSQVSFLADIFQQNHYGMDLLSYLKDGGGSMPWDGLSDDHLKILTSLVSNLPSYKV